MDTLTMNKKLTNLPLPEPFSWEFAIKYIGGFITFLIAYFGYLNKYFANKKTEKEAFIKAVVKEAMDVSLVDVKADIRELKTFRETDMRHFNDTVLQIHAELRRANQ